MASSAALLRISIGAITRRGVALARTTAGLLVFAFAAADTELFAAGFSTNIAGTTCEPMGEIGANSLLPGAIIVADNMIRPGGEGVARYGQAVRAKPKIASVLLPVGSGLEISRFDAEQRLG